MGELDCAENEVSRIVLEIVTKWEFNNAERARLNVMRVDKIFDDDPKEAMQHVLMIELKDANDPIFCLFDRLYEYLGKSGYEFNRLDKHSKNGRSYDLTWFVDISLTSRSYAV
jgi:hypothetical protein